MGGWRKGMKSCEKGREGGRGRGRNSGTGIPVPKKGTARLGEANLASKRGKSASGAGGRKVGSCQLIIYISGPKV